MDAISTQQADEPSRTGHPQLSEEVQNRIGNQLRLLYDQVADEPVPDHIIELLKRLETKE